MHEIDPAAAQLALHDVDERRRQIADEVRVPAAYWWGVAGGWIVLGVVSDTGNAVASLVATFVFGAVHSAVAPRLLSGRHGSNRLSVRAEVAGRHMAAVLLACLVGLAGVTVVLALLANADGARHPATMASVVVAVAILCGGPGLVAALRRRSMRTAGH